MKQLLITILVISSLGANAQRIRDRVAAEKIAALEVKIDSLNAAVEKEFPDTLEFDFGDTTLKVPAIDFVNLITEIKVLKDKYDQKVEAQEPKTIWEKLVIILTLIVTATGSAFATEAIKVGKFIVVFAKNLKIHPMWWTVVISAAFATGGTFLVNKAWDTTTFLLIMPWFFSIATLAYRTLIKKKKQEL